MHTRTSYISHEHRAPSMFDLIHSDVWGLPVTALFPRRCDSSTFIDDHSRCTWVYLLKKKFESFTLSLLTFVK